MDGPQSRLLQDGKRLHLHHGPIDLIIEAWGSDHRAAYGQAKGRFQSILSEIVRELPQLRMKPDREYIGKSPVTRRMISAVQPWSEILFVTPMAAVAGAVADEILAAMDLRSLRKAYVNNGGDIAVRLAPGETFNAKMPVGSFAISDADNVGGVATSGWQGRSHSLGIADAVTVLASNAAEADVAATLIANAVNLDHKGIVRVPADEVSPDSDLKGRLVTRHVPALTTEEKQCALVKGAHLAQKLIDANRLTAVMLSLQGETLTCGMAKTKDLEDARF